MEAKKPSNLGPVLPSQGHVFNEKNLFSEIVCKPKLMALKSITMQKLEDMEKQLLTAQNNIK